MQEGAAARTPPGPLAATALTLPAILAPLLFLVALVPARTVVEPLLGLMEPFGAAGDWLAFIAWFGICVLLAQVVAGSIARALVLARRTRRVFVVSVCLWAALPNVALLVLFATGPD